jgi:hypothetical protein
VPDSEFESENDISFSSCDFFTRRGDIFEFLIEEGVIVNFEGGEFPLTFGGELALSAGCDWNRSDIDDE